MKNRFMRGAALGLAMVTAFTFTAPNSALLSAEAAAKQATAATKITAKAASVKVGKTAKVKVTINKKATKKVTINVKAKNAKIAKVAKKLTIKKGKKAATLKVKGLKKGSTKLTLSFKNSKGKTVKKTIKVTVKKAAAAKVAATGVTLDKTAYTVGLAQSLTMFATPVPANTTDKATWTSSDETVATVADGVVTGVKEGKATITVAYNENATATAEVTVSKDAIIYNLTAAKQVAANKVELTFDNPEAKNLTQKTDVVVSRKDGTQVLAIDSFAWDATGAIAVATLQTSFNDKVDYTVAFKSGTPIEFTASVGEVATAAVLTASAQKGVETKVDVALYDANGMDVTAAISNSDSIDININGNAQIVNSGNWKRTAIVMDTVGETVDVTVSYTKNGAQDAITATGKITCIEATAVVGTGVFVSTGNTNTKSESAKFYLSGMSASNITVEEDKNKDDVYFYAYDENGYAIKYDSYEVTSSADDTMTVEINSSYESDSKFTRMEITGNKKGQAVVNVKAIKNDKETMYTIPVTVVEKAKLSSIVVKLDKSNISNAYDGNYYGKISVKGKNQRGEYFKMDSVSVELDDSSKDKADDLALVNTGSSTTITDTNGNFGFNIKGFDLKNTFNGPSDLNGAYQSSVGLELNTAADAADDEYTGVYKAWGVAPASFKVKVTGSYEGEEKTASTTISVKGLSKAAWNVSGNYNNGQTGVALKYDIELDDTTLDEAAPTTHSTKAKLAAYEGSTFAGYVYSAESGFTTSVAADIANPTGTIYFAAVGWNLDGTTNPTTGSSVGVVTNSSTSMTTSESTVAIKGSVIPKASDSMITNIKGYVNKGGRYSKVDDPANINLYLFAGSSASNSTSSAAQIGRYTNVQPVGFGISSVNSSAGAKVYVPGEQKYDQYFAQTGAYTVKFEYTTLKDGLSSKDNIAKYMVSAAANGAKNYTSGKTVKSKTLNVKNTMFVPTLTYTTKNVEGMTSSDIIDVLETNVDLNNNESMHESIKDLYKSLTMSSTSIGSEDVSYGSTSTTVKYATVETNLSEGTESDESKRWGTVTYILPLGQTFYTE